MPSVATVTQRAKDALVGSRKRALVVLGVIVVAFMFAGYLHGRNPAVYTQTATGDGKYYELMIKQWLVKGVYAYKSEKPNAVVTPGYPIVLAAVYKLTGFGTYPAGGPYPLIFALQLLFAAGSIVLTYLIAEELLGRGPGLVAAGLMAAFPPMVASAAKILTEPLAMLLFLGYLYAQLLAMRRGIKWLYPLAGALFAWVVMVRPSFLPLAVLPFLYALLKKPRAWKDLLVPVGLFAAAFAIVVTPWVARNVATLHQPLLLPNGRGDPVLAGVDPYYWEMGTKYRYSGPSYEAYVNAHQPGQPVPAQFDTDKGTYGKRVMATMLRHQPARFLTWITIGKFRAMFGRTWEGGSRNVLTVTWFVQSILVAFGFAGVLLAIVDDRLRIPALLVVIGTAALLPFVPEPRFVFGFLPLLAILAAGTLSRAFATPRGDPEPV